MSDNFKSYYIMLIALKQRYPTEPTGNLARHLTTMAALVSGIVGSKKPPLPAIAGKVPDLVMDIIFSVRMVYPQELTLPSGTDGGVHFSLCGRKPFPTNQCC